MRKFNLKIYKTKLCRPVDLAFLKWASILFGMIIGAYFSDFVKKYIFIFIFLAIIFSAKFIYFLFKE